MVTERNEFNREGPIGLTARHIISSNVVAQEIMRTRLSRKMAIIQGDRLLNVLEELNLKGSKELPSIQRRTIERYKLRHAPNVECDTQSADPVELHDLVLYAQLCIMHGEDPYFDPDSEEA